MGRRYSQAKVDEARAAYEAYAPTMYDPDSITVDELARQLNISKPTLYDWRRQGWRVNGSRRSSGTNGAVVQLESDLHELTTKVSEMRRRLSDALWRIETLEAG